MRNANDADKSTEEPNSSGCASCENARTVVGTPAGRLCRSCADDLFERLREKARAAVAAAEKAIAELSNEELQAQLDAVGQPQEAE